MTKMPPGPRSGRNASLTRERILAAARRYFSLHGYDHVGTRDIAREAGADAALVNRYFGSKEELFREVITGGFLVEEHLPEDLADFGSFLVSQVLDNKSEPDDFDALRVLLRAADSPAIAALVAERFDEEFIRPLARRLGGRDAEVRATLIASYVLGLATMRYGFEARSLSGAPGRKASVLAEKAIQACATPA